MPPCSPAVVTLSELFKDSLDQSSEGMRVTGLTSLQPPSAAATPKIQGVGAQPLPGSHSPSKVLAPASRLARQFWRVCTGLLVTTSQNKDGAKVG